MSSAAHVRFTSCILGFNDGMTIYARHDSPDTYTCAFVHGRSESICGSQSSHGDLERSSRWQQRPAGRERPMRRSVTHT